MAIEWSSSGYGSQAGHVGRIHAFTISYRGDPGWTYELRSRLPVDDRWLDEPYGTADDAKRGAREALRAFLAYLRNHSQEE